MRYQLWIRFVSCLLLFSLNSVFVFLRCSLILLCGVCFDSLRDSFLSLTTSVKFFTVRLLFCLCRHALAECPFFPQLLHIDSSAGHLRNGLQIGLLQNLHSRVPVNFVFDLVPNFFILCIGFSLYFQLFLLL